MSSIKRKLEELERDVKKIKTENHNLKKDLIEIRTKCNFKTINFMEYKFIINGRIQKILEYINVFRKKRCVSKERVHFMIHNCYKIINDVYERHPFSFKEEYKDFTKVVDFLMEICEENELNHILFNINYKLINIYDLMKDYRFKFDAYIGVILYSFYLNYIDYAKTLIRNMNNNFSLYKITEEDEEILQLLKNKVYGI